MKHIAFITATSLLLASAATAGGISFSLPNLTFPTAADVTVAKDCIATNATADVCIPQE